jgi:UDP-N-acetyl-D-mannosaminuronic acid dehydrogenase
MAATEDPIRKIVVFGAGIVGVPMAAAFARARIGAGTDGPAGVVLVQRDSPTSGWKVGAINAGRSPFGGVEPELAGTVAEAAAAGILRASFDPAEARDADAVLFCVQTDKNGFAPDYGPLRAAADSAARALRDKPPGKHPLLVFESTLAPTSLATVFRDLFAAHGLEDGRDILLGHSPNRVMPGFLMERIRRSDKIAGGLNPETGPRIKALYRNIVTEGRLHLTSAVTAETAKTLENAARDVRIAYSAEVARACDALDFDFHKTREAVNAGLSWEDREGAGRESVPTGALLVPTIGVGGHCLPKDGILLLWRMIERGRDVSGSLILESRRINDESPGLIAARLERLYGPLSGRKTALLGAAYRPNSEDTRNAPTLALALQLQARGGTVTIHDPYVRTGDQNLRRTGLDPIFTQELGGALAGADIVVFCVSHRVYQDGLEEIVRRLPGGTRLFDGCHIAGRKAGGLVLPGIGKGRLAPPAAFTAAVSEGFRMVERGLALELAAFVRFINETFPDPWNRLDFDEVRRLVATCPTGCRIVEPEAVSPTAGFERFDSRLAARAARLSGLRNGGS